MTIDQVKQLLTLLQQFEREMTYDTMPRYIAGEWSRANVQSFREDVKTVAVLGWNGRVT